MSHPAKSYSQSVVRVITVFWLRSDNPCLLLVLSQAEVRQQSYVLKLAHRSSKSSLDRYQKRNLTALPYPNLRLYCFIPPLTFFWVAKREYGKLVLMANDTVIQWKKHQLPSTLKEEWEKWMELTIPRILKNSGNQSSTSRIHNLTTVRQLGNLRNIHSAADVKLHGFGDCTKRDYPTHYGCDCLQNWTFLSCFIHRNYILSASFVCNAVLSASEYTATVFIPISLQALIILTAISPLFAINIFFNISISNPFLSTIILLQM